MCGCVPEVWFHPAAVAPDLPEGDSLNWPGTKWLANADDQRRAGMIGQRPWPTAPPLDEMSEPRASLSEYARRHEPRQMRPDGQAFGPPRYGDSSDPVHPTCCVRRSSLQGVPLGSN